MSSSGSVGNIHWADIVVIVLYLAGSLALGIWTIYKSKSDLKGFFLAGRSMKWWPIGMSLFASNIGANNFVGIAGSAAASGTAVVMFEWNAVWLLMLLGWVFLPVYIASAIYTMPEYLQRRFGGQRLRIYLSIIQLTTYVFATLSVDLYAGSVFLQQTLGWNIYGGVAFLLAITVVFTAFGGLKTVILTDALAVIVMVIGGFILCIIGFVEVGGLTALHYKYMHAAPNTTINNPNTSCGLPREDAWHIFRLKSNPEPSQLTALAFIVIQLLTSLGGLALFVLLFLMLTSVLYRDPWNADYPWLGTMLRTTLGSLWYWCANQVLVQRALAAKNITHSKGATILAAYLKLTPMFLMVIPGIISRALYPDEVACADPVICEAVCENPVGCTNIALPKLVVELLPLGLRGLLIASMIAAVISSLTSIFNSSSTLFTLDIYSKIRPTAGETELLLFGKLFVIVLTAIAVMWIPMMTGAQGGEIFKYSTTITGYFGAPTCAMFVLAMFWNGITEPGAFWGMLVAQLWGLVRFVLDFVYPAPSCQDLESGLIDDRPGIVKDFHAYYHTFSQIVLAFALAAVISLFTTPPPRHQLGGLTFWSKYEKPWKDIMYEKYKQGMRVTIDIHGSSPDEEGTDRPVVESERGASGGMRDVGGYVECRERKTGQRANGFSANGDMFTTEEEGNQPHSDDNHMISDVIEEQEEPMEDHKTRMLYLQQTPFWRKCVNVNAIVVMTVTAFLYGFFY